MSKPRRSACFPRPAESRRSLVLLFRPAAALPQRSPQRGQQHGPRPALPLILLLALLASCSPGPAGEAPQSPVGKGGARGLAALFSRLAAAGRRQHLAEDLAARLEEHVRILASDELSGRLVGSEGIALAERHIEATFKRQGLDPLPGRKGYALDFDLYSGGYDPETTALSIQVDGRDLAAVPGRDFRPFPFSALGEKSGPLLFAGYGITAPEYGYDDYEGLEVEGRFVLVLRYEPESDPGDEYFRGAELTRHSLFLTKARNAAERGAAGLLLVSGADNPPGAEDLRLQPAFDLSPAAGRGSGGGRQDILAAHISRELAAALLRPSGLDLEALPAAAGGGAAAPGGEKGGGAPLSGTVNVRLSVSLRPEADKVAARNLAGFIRGADPELKDEWILIGAHHDHLGSFSGEGDTIFNGADDNASGTAALLALAGLLSRSEPPPRRSLAFVTFSAEEQGLFGSRAFTGGQAELERVVLMINLDMLGRNPEKPLQIMGDAYSPPLRALVEQANREIGLALSFGGARYSAASDHDPFFRQGIPFLFFFTGTHEDYHGTGDHADKLAYGRLADIVRLVRATAAEAASERAELGSSVSVWWLGLTARVSEKAGVSRPAGAGDQAAGARGPAGASAPAGALSAAITAVEPGSQAAKNGLQAGDSILAVDGAPVSGPRELRRQLGSVQPGQTLSLRLLREGRELELSISRAPAGFLGVSIEQPGEELLRRNGLREDEGVLVSRVLPGGPAERAGLQAGDIILMLDTHPVSPDNLSLVLARIGAGSAVRLAVLRREERLEIGLTLGRRP